MDTLISLLIYALRHLHPSPDVDQNLRATLCRLVEEMYTDPAYYVAVNLQQNAQVLCSAIRWPSESPLVANLSVHLDHLTSNQPLSKDDTCERLDFLRVMCPYCLSPIHSAHTTPCRSVLAIQVL